MRRLFLSSHILLDCLEPNAPYTAYLEGAKPTPLNLPLQGPFAYPDHGRCILEVNGQEVNNVGEFNQALKKSEETKKTYLFVKSGGTVYYVTLPLND